MSLGTSCLQAAVCWLFPTTTESAPPPASITAQAPPIMALVLWNGVPVREMKASSLEIFMKHFKVCLFAKPFEGFESRHPLRGEEFMCYKRVSLQHMELLLNKLFEELQSS